MNDIDLLHKFLATLLQYLERPAVLRQLVAALFVMLLVWAISRWVIKPVSTRMVQKMVEREAGEQPRRFLRIVVVFIQHSTLPVLGIGGLLITGFLFQALGWFYGLFGIFFFILWVTLAYRLLVAFLYAGLGEDVMNLYHKRFLSPLFSVLMIALILANFTNLTNLLNMPLWQGMKAPVTIGRLLIATLGLYFWIQSTAIIQNILRALIVPKTSMNAGAVNAALSIGRSVFIAIGIYLAFGALGVDSSTLAFISGGLSVGIGLGLQQIVSNFVSGVILLFEQSLRPGDVISINNSAAIVDTLGIRATTVKTFDNVRIIIPNDSFLTSSVTTYTKDVYEIRVVVTVGSSYDNNPEEVRELLLAIAASHEQILQEPAPLAWFINFGDSSLDFELAVWINDVMIMKTVASQIRMMIWTQFKEHGIEIPFPQRDIHIRSGIPEALARASEQSVEALKRASVEANEALER